MNNTKKIRIIYAEGCSCQILISWCYWYIYKTISHIRTLTQRKSTNRTQQKLYNAFSDNKAQKQLRNYESLYQQNACVRNFLNYVWAKEEIKIAIISY